MSTNVRAASFDGHLASAWWAARLPAWVLPALTCFWFVAVLIAAVGDSPGCSADGAGSCGPDLGSALRTVALLGVPVLLWWSPAVGCAAGIVFCAVDVFVDGDGSVRIAFAVYGLTCLAVAGWLVRVRAAQRAFVAQVAVVPVALGHVRAGGPRRSRLVAVAVLAVTAASLYAWYTHLIAVEDGHVAAAETHVVQVVAGSDRSITVTMPSGARQSVYAEDPERYPLGSSVPVLIDPHDQSWIRVVGESEDPTAWATASFAAGAVTAALLAREITGVRARRRLVAIDQASRTTPGIPVRVSGDERGAALVYAADDELGERPLAVVAVRWAGESVTSSAGSSGSGALRAGSGPESSAGGSAGARPSGDVPDELADDEAFGRAWRGELSMVGTAVAGTLAGGLHDGAWPALVVGGDVLLPDAPLRTFRSPPGAWWRLLRMEGSGLPGRPVPVNDAVSVPELPAVVRGPGIYRRAGVVALAGGLLGAPAAVLAGLDVAAAAWLGAILLANGLFAIGRSVVLGSDRLTVRGPLVVHRVAWQHLHGARLVGDRLVLAWRPASVVAVGPFEPMAGSAGRREQAEWVGAVIMVLRGRNVAGTSGTAVADASAGVQVVRAPGFGFATMVAYILLVAAAWWWRTHNG